MYLQAGTFVFCNEIRKFINEKHVILIEEMVHCC